MSALKNTNYLGKVVAQALLYLGFLALAACNAEAPSSPAIEAPAPTGGGAFLDYLCKPGNCGLGMVASERKEEGKLDVHSLLVMTDPETNKIVPARGLAPGVNVNWSALNVIVPTGCHYRITSVETNAVSTKNLINIACNGTGAQEKVEVVAQGNIEVVDTATKQTKSFKTQVSARVTPVSLPAVEDGAPMKSKNGYTFSGN